MSRESQHNGQLAQIERHWGSKAALIDRICKEVAQGKSLKAITRREHMPDIATLRRWLVEDAAFLARYEKARAVGRIFALDEVLALAEDMSSVEPTEARLKFAAYKWWLTQTAKEMAAEAKAAKEARSRATAAKRQELKALAETFSTLEADEPGAAPPPASASNRPPEPPSAPEPKVSQSEAPPPDKPAPVTKISAPALEPIPPAPNLADPPKRNPGSGPARPPGPTREPDPVLAVIAKPANGGGLSRAAAPAP